MAVRFLLRACAPIAITFSCASLGWATLTLAIGNSLTWDAQPERLDGEVHHHIVCGSNLQQIADGAFAPCVNNDHTRALSDALAMNTYDFVTVQPYPGTTLAQDVAIISGWMTQQPSATFVVHSGWTWVHQSESTYHAGLQTDEEGEVVMTHTPDYFSELTQALSLAHPGREIRSTQTVDLLDSIRHDIESGDAPYDNMGALYRDGLHASYDDGRLLAHNALRAALGQPLSGEIVPGVDPAAQAYLLGKIAAIPEPSPLLFFAVLACGAAAKRRRRASVPAA